MSNGNGGWYYLHTNGSLIWKKYEPEIDSPFVKKVWPIDITDRSDGWKIVLEALSMGLKLDRAKELSEKWGLNQEDFEEMLVRMKPTAQMQKGAHIFIKDILRLNPDEYWDELLKRKGEKL